MGTQDSRINGNGMPDDFTGKVAPRYVDGSYKSNNGNLDVQPTSTVFDPTAEGVGPWNKGYGTTNASRPFSK